MSDFMLKVLPNAITISLVLPTTTFITCGFVIISSLPILVNLSLELLSSSPSSPFLLVPVL